MPKPRSFGLHNALFQPVQGSVYPVMRFVELDCNPGLEAVVVMTGITPSPKLICKRVLLLVRCELSNAVALPSTSTTVFAHGSQKVFGTRNLNVTDSVDTGHTTGSIGLPAWSCTCKNDT